MKDWIDSWRSDPPPSLPGLALFCNTKQTVVYYVGACPKNIAIDSQNFLCEFGQVSRVCHTFYRDDCALYWWAIPRELSLIGQLPNILSSLSKSLVPVLSVEIPQLSPVLDEDII